MPIETSTFQLPRGARGARVVASGHVSKEDADAYVKDTNAGGPLFGLPQLVLTQQQDSISSGARGIFATLGSAGEKEPWIAVVVSNTVTRVVNNFMVRVLGRKRVKLFNGEPEAIQCRSGRRRVLRILPPIP